MDKQTVFGFILIGIVLMVWMWVQAPPEPSRSIPRQADSLGTPHSALKDRVESEPVKSPTIGSVEKDTSGKYFSHLVGGPERRLIIKTDLYTAEVSTHGGLIRKWELTKYFTWDKYPVNIVDYEQGGDFSLLFTSSDGKLINTRHLTFLADFPTWKTVELRNDESYTVELRLEIAPGKSIVKQMTFTNGKYSFDAAFKFQNVGDVIANYEYQVLWETGLRYAEHNSVDESNSTKAFAYSGGELAEIDAADVAQTPDVDIEGSTSWVAARNKYFAVVMIPDESKSRGALLQGHRVNQPDKGVRESYALAVKMPLLNSASESATFTVFLGPLDIDVIQSYGKNIDEIISLGPAWIIRPISKYVLLPLLGFLRMFIPNFGFVIIVFSIIIKIVLHPLTKTSMKSMKQMQALQPLMTEIREKHKDDPQKMNQQIMNLYKEYGVNPASGCLPLLLQMPILFALYSVFSSSIELRQASFMFWITDLSVPDEIVKLPFTIPLFQIVSLSGLALAMGVTMFIQQKMTVTDPRQKAMVWMMPVMMTLLFNSFPSGLNLYYFVFNLLSIIQQSWVNKKHGDEPLRKVDPKKHSGGIMGRLSKDLPKFGKR
ncbi:MAG: membrane protein insertase YidC [Bacteroidota bacterium]